MIFITSYGKYYSQILDTCMDNDVVSATHEYRLCVYPSQTNIQSMKAHTMTKDSQINAV